MTISKPQKTVTVKKSDLPVSCPMQGQEVWDEHPRVFLSFDKSDSESCPYCNTKYILAK